ncbi:hypothetical protein NQ318_015641 [Aromia moschata]|uniref:HTH CENPB-type domain-containing protein n=1 Tax=Aromia moschata TaxID=1265417 RepID=A0AAV8XD73_9CUCU|nr:hypothetical protein NQ318_015641 [Aromia moschata]
MWRIDSAFHSTMTSILKKRDVLATTSSTAKWKRQRTCEFPQLEHCLLEWFTQCRLKNVPIEGPLLKEKATFFAEKLGISVFKASGGWLDKFKKGTASSCIKYALQAFVDDYKNCNLQIVLICEKMCDTLLISIKPNYAFELDELINDLASHMDSVIDKLISYYQQTIQFIILVFEGFEVHMAAIKFKPALVEVAAVISNMLNSLVEALTSLPRLNDKFHVAETNFKSYSQIIAEDQTCQHLQTLLNQEVRVNIEKVKEYMKIWEPFRDLWEVDKDKFIARYEKGKSKCNLI